ncbi:MAG: hypothetical protein IKG42_06000 [Clostridia bacterium]|nr:hypothetical protein [Clostridia bacterium]
MLKNENGRIIRFLIEFFLLVLFILGIAVGAIFLIAPYLGYEVKITGDSPSEIEMVVYRKKANDNKYNDEPIDIYIQNDLSLDDENLSNSVYTENDYFYNQLDEYGKHIYEKIIANSENLKSGDFVIKFNSEFSDLLSRGGDEQLKTAYKNAVDCIRYDRMELFYIDFTKMYLKIETTTRGNNVSYNVYIEKGKEDLNYYIDGIENRQQLEQILETIEQKRSEILLNTSGSNYQKILQVHDFLVNNLSYDETYERANNDNLIGVFLDGNVVCEGYAKAFKYLLDGLEIPCILVIGDAVNSVGENEKHMWNYVQINDGWYAVDVTWDDPILVGKSTLSDESRYRYFCREADFNNNHFSDGAISVNGTEFIYPELVGN